MSRPHCKNGDRRRNLAKRILLARVLVAEHERRLEQLDGQEYSNFETQGAHFAERIRDSRSPVPETAIEGFLSGLKAI